MALSYEMALAIFEAEEWQVSSLTVLYDDNCPLCRRLRDWLGHQRLLMPVEFVAAGSVEARRRYPGLDHERTARVLTVVAQTGAVYEGERAWLVCAWSLVRWRAWSEHFTRRLRWVRAFSRAVDRYRHTCPTCASRAQAPPAHA